MQGPLSSRSHFIFDLDGCVFTGDEVVPGAPDVIRFLRSQGKTVTFLTNNSTLPIRAIVEKLQGMSVEASEEGVVTALWALARDLKETFGSARVLVMGPDSMAQALAGLGHQPVPFSRWEEAQAVAVGRDVDINYDRLCRAVWAVRAGARLVAANLDPVFPVEGGVLMVGAGAIVRAVEAGAEVEAHVIGKPQPGIFRWALDRWGTTADDAVMVGDRYASDVVGAHSVGMPCVLVGGTVPEGAGGPPDAQYPDMYAFLSDLQAGRV